jgi:hypothetical protein
VTIKDPNMIGPQIAWIQNDGACTSVTRLLTTPGTPVSVPNIVPLRFREQLLRNNRQTLLRVGNPSSATILPG